MKTKLSICIVAYNNYEEILKAIESIEKETTKEIAKEIIIIDNSEEVNKDTIQRFRFSLRKYKDIRYLKMKRNVGFGKGHNVALKLIDSTYHAIINPDILIKEDVFDKIISFMEKNKDVGMLIPKITNENGERQDAYRRDLTVSDMFIRMFCKKAFRKRMAYHSMKDMDYSKMFQVPFGQGCFLVIRTTLFRELKGFDERFFMYLEDADLCKRVNSCSKLVYYPGATVIHKWERGSHKNIKLFLIHIRSMITYFKKWGIKIA